MVTSVLREAKNLVSPVYGNKCLEYFLFKMSNEPLDIDKYRTEFECDEHWKLRRKFLLSHQDKYPEDRLVCLSQTYTNIKFLGCRYPEETMKTVAFLAQGIVDEVGEKQKGQLHETSTAVFDNVQAKVEGGKTEINHMPRVPENQHTHSHVMVSDVKLPDKSPVKVEQSHGSSVGCLVSKNVLSSMPHLDSSQKTMHQKAKHEENPFLKMLMLENFGSSARHFLGQIMSSCKIQFCYKCINVAENKVMAVLVINGIRVSQFEECSNSKAKSGAANSALIKLRETYNTVKGPLVADVKSPLYEVVGSEKTCKETSSRSRNLGEKLYGRHHNEFKAAKKQAREQLCQLIQCFLQDCIEKQKRDSKTFTSEFASDENGTVPGYPEETMKTVAFLAQGIVDEVGEKQKGQLHETSTAVSDNVQAKVEVGKPETNHMPLSVPENQHTRSHVMLSDVKLPDKSPVKVEQSHGSSVGCLVSQNVLSSMPHQDSSQKTMHLMAEHEENPFFKMLMVEDFGSSARNVLGQIMSSLKIHFHYTYRRLIGNKVMAVLLINKIQVSQYEDCTKTKAKSGAANSALIKLRETYNTVKGPVVTDVRNFLPEVVGSDRTCKETSSRSLNLGEELYGGHHNEFKVTEIRAREQLRQLIQCFLQDCIEKQKGDNKTFTSEFTPDENGTVPGHPKKRKWWEETFMTQGKVDEFREKQEGQLCKNSVAARVKDRKRKTNMPWFVPEEQDKHSTDQQSSFPTYDSSQENMPMNVKPQLGNVVIVEDFGTCANSVMKRSMAACNIKSRYQYERTFTHVKAKLLLDDVPVSVGVGCTSAKAREEAARFALMELKKTCYTIKAKPEFVRGTTVDRSLWQKLYPPVQDQSEIQRKIQETQMADVDTPLPDNIGSNIMRKMGWTGGALGRNTTGITEPISVIQKKGLRAGFGLAEEKINKGVVATKKLTKAERKKDMAARKTALFKFRQQVESFLHDYASQDKKDDLIFNTKEFLHEENRAIRKIAFKMKLDLNTYKNIYLVVSKKISLRNEAEKLLSGCSSDKYELISPKPSTNNNNSVVQLSSGNNLHAVAGSVTFTESA